MPHLATSRSPEALAQSVKAMHQKFRFLAAVALPDPSMGGRITPASRLALYGHHENCTGALIEAVADHPGCERFGEYEYLPNEIWGEIMAANASDPIAQAFHSLGLIKPDGSPIT